MKRKVLGAPSLYRALNRLRSDPAAGRMRGISGALNVKDTQVYVNHPPRETAAAGEVPAGGVAAPAQ